MDSPSNQAGAHELRQADEHFTELVSSVQDYAIFLLDAHGNVISWNSGAQRIKGYEPAEIIGKHFSIFYPADAIARRWPEYELEVASRVGRFEDEAARLRKDGSRFWANVVITALYEADGSVRGFLKITRDLSERKAAEESLRQSEERFRLLVEGVKDYAIFMLDPEGRVVSWNAGAERIKGYQADEIIGQHFSIFYPSEDVQSGKPLRELVDAQANGSVEDEGWRVRKDRSLFWAAVVITALYDDRRKLVGYAKLTRDMTLKRRIEALEIADRHKNEFLAMLAHELRNPLAPISNGLQLLKLPGVDDATFRDTTEMMERQTGHLVRLVDDLLDVSRIIMGKMDYQKQPVDVVDTVRRAIEESQPTIDARGHELMLTLPARAVIVDVDSMRIAQVISNLLVNAAKYTDKPSQIWLSVERVGEQAVIRVKDSGTGIDPDALPHIFDLFVQADSSLARTRGGLGIGLTLVKRIVESHGGSVVAASAGLGHGSEFSVSLPISAAQSSAPTISSLTREPNALRRRILVVDDNVDAVRTISLLLKAWGHEVHSAHTGPAALDAVQTFQPEIILLDIGLPGMSGYDVAKRLRSEPHTRSVVIAALTGYGQESDRQRSFEAGCDYHLTKPPNPNVLESLLAAPRLRSASALQRGENN